MTIKKEDNEPYSHPSCLPEGFKGVYVLRMNLYGAGFGAMLLQTLNQIRYCERNGLLPVVNYDQSCNSYFYDKHLGNNMWEQYFEPLILGFDFQTVLRLCEDPDNALTVDGLQNLEDEEMLQICEHHPDSIYTFTFADWRKKPPEDLEQWYAQQRLKGSDVFLRYIRVKPAILDKINEFYRNFFEGYQVLGLHIRGTDLMYAPPVSPAEYFEHIDNWLAEQVNPRIFVATDQAQYLSVFKQRYGSRIIAYDSSRSTNEIVPVNLKHIPAYKKGEDVLLDMMLLSKTNALIKGASAIGEMALYINPGLPCVDLASKKRFAFGQDYGKGWNGVLLSQTKPAWLLLKNQDLSRESKHAKTQTGLQVLLYKCRPYYSPPLIFLKRVINYLHRLLTTR